ncbi:MAG: PTS sugar transporter subunit IIA [candidate division WOR-3 bacterium]
MRLSRYLRPDLIEPNLTLTEKDQVLDYLARMARRGLGPDCQADTDTILNALRERENVTSTGIGNGVAIPHAKVEGLQRMSLVFARSLAGVSFQALDEAPVQLIFLVIAPPSIVSDYLKLLAAISSFVRSEKNRTALLKANTPAEIIAAVKAGETA